MARLQHGPTRFQPVLENFHTFIEGLIRYPEKYKGFYSKAMPYPGTWAITKGLPQWAEASRYPIGLPTSVQFAVIPALANRPRIEKMNAIERIRDESSEKIIA